MLIASHDTHAIRAHITQMIYRRREEERSGQRREEGFLVAHQVKSEEREERERSEEFACHENKSL
jgi:hypothetical protein